MPRGMRVKPLKLALTGAAALATGATIWEVQTDCMAEDCEKLRVRGKVAVESVLRSLQLVTEKLQSLGKRRDR